MYSEAIEEEKLLLELPADLGIAHVVLEFQACKV